MIWFYIVPLVLSLIFAAYFIYESVFLLKEPILVKELIMFTLWNVTPLANIFYLGVCIFVVYRDSDRIKRFLNKRVL